MEKVYYIHKCAFLESIDFETPEDFEKAVKMATKELLLKGYEFQQIITMERGRKAQWLKIENNSTGRWNIREFRESILDATYHTVPS
jgi:hypothetical protein